MRSHISISIRVNMGVFCQYIASTLLVYYMSLFPTQTSRFWTAPPKTLVIHGENVLDAFPAWDQCICATRTGGGAKAGDGSPHVGSRGGAGLAALHGSRVAQVLVVLVVLIVLVLLVVLASSTSSTSQGNTHGRLLCPSCSFLYDENLGEITIQNR
jgi:hypothetical protein